MGEFIFDGVTFDLAQSELARESLQTLELILSHLKTCYTCPVANWSSSYWLTFPDDSFAVIFDRLLGAGHIPRLESPPKCVLCALNSLSASVVLNPSWLTGFTFPHLLMCLQHRQEQFSITDVRTLLLVRSQSVHRNDHFGLVILWWVYCSNCEALVSNVLF